MNKRATLTMFMVSLVVISMVAAGFVSIMGGMEESYGKPAPKEINETYNQLNNIEERTESLTETFRTGSLAEAIGFFPKGVINFLMLIPDMLKIATTFLTQGVADLGLDGWVLAGIVSIITIVIVLLVVSVLARAPV